MILAAGQGTRVRPLTKNMPKPMVPILGKPVMEYLIEHLARHGIRAVLNCALNLDVNLVETPAPDSRNQGFGRAGIRYYKLGLIDGPGNPAEMLLEWAPLTDLYRMAPKFTKVTLRAAAEVFR